ncbi:MAG: Gfo/Idh/MocA family oxidoreductase [Oscillospiraceae bacterium]|nr:Gfo/Idh/MocA family oxidoreductase [Oscillospiraceae bacterium]
MSYALIGCGRIAANHIKAAVKNGLRIAAVCDVIPQKAEALLKNRGLDASSSIRRYADYKLMLSQVRPQLVAIATESGKHAKIALDCIGAGASLIIEKPMALSIKDADAIIAAGKEKGVKVCACHQNRFNLSVQRLRAALEGGRFGKLSHGAVHVRWSRNEAYYKQAPWRGTWEEDGGALMNQSIHGIDLLRWMLGDDIEEVFAYASNRLHPYIEAEDIGIAVVKFKSGATATIEGTTNVYPENLEETLYIFGENGTVKLGGKSLNAIDIFEFSDKCEAGKGLEAGFIEETENVYGNGHAPLYKDVISALENDREPYIDAEAGRRALELVLAIYRSAREGRPVRLPLEDFSTREMTGIGWGTN